MQDWAGEDVKLTEVLGGVAVLEGVQVPQGSRDPRCCRGQEYGARAIKGVGYTLQWFALGWSWGREEGKRATPARASELALCDAGSSVQGGLTHWQAFRYFVRRRL